MGRYIIAALGLALLSGCANLTTFSKKVDLTKTSLSVDAKQRVIYGRTIDTNNDDKLVILCAEPSPDALSVLGASGALSVTEASGAGGSTSGALSEAAASIGLRTTSIQLLRDLNYRICEAYNNQAITSEDVASLLRRGQSTMMGLIAIEQLTGPVVAAQATLNAAGSAGTGGSQGDVTTAQTGLETAQNKLLDAQAALDTATSDLTQKQNELKTANSELSSATSAQTPDAAVMEAKKTAVETAQHAVTTAANIQADKQRRVTAAQKNVDSAQATLTAARREGTLATGASAAVLGAISSANANITSTLAGEVGSIVGEINKAYIIDTCLGTLQSYAQSPSGDGRPSSAREAARENAYITLVDACRRVLDETRAGGGFLTQSR